MTLDPKKAKKRLRKNYPNGSYSVTYFFNCSCGAEISCQSGYLRTHSGKCRSCTQKKRPYQSAYTNLIGNKKRGLSVEISYEEFYKLCKERFCHYCWGELRRSFRRGEHGYRNYLLDRKDNAKGYTSSNCVPCCWKCNQAKGNRYSYEEFFQMTSIFRKTISSEPERDHFLIMNHLYE